MAESSSKVDAVAISDDVGDLCALCREEKKNPQNLDCGHSFCGACLENFKGYRNKHWGRCCPLCRQPIAGISSAVRNELLIDLTLSDEESNAQDGRVVVSSSDDSTDSSTSDDSSSTTETESNESIDNIDDFGNLVYVDEYEMAYFESNILTDDELYFYTDSDDTVEGLPC